jgi:hypothetical protein
VVADGWLDLDRDLVGRAADAARTHLEGRADVVQRRLSTTTGSVPVFSRDALECAVDDALGDGLLAVQENLVDQLRDNGAP